MARGARPKAKQIFIKILKSSKTCAIDRIPKSSKTSDLPKRRNLKNTFGAAKLTISQKFSKFAVARIQGVHYAHDLPPPLMAPWAGQMC